ncbi:hypothetical protein WA026_000386 [Henosepilachna vigintioctopunctata]|uniref:Phospholipase A2 n=2 Tax=Henosepilachna vigintioctopunctata TaxID=420089 RepID=A0AAW1V4Z9_9CUCU
MKHKTLLFYYFCVLIHISGLVPAVSPEKKPFKVKVFDGKKVRKDSTLTVFHHDMSIAVAEHGPDKQLLNCNVMAISVVEDIDRAIGPLKGKTSIVPITMEEMLHLMNQCAELDQTHPEDHTPVAPPNEEEMKNFTERLKEIKAIFTNKSEVLSGIVPGTKWCGTGDLAKDYHELGADSLTDTCCRNHDLCPVKIRAFSKKYGLTNKALYTKSHCRCDDIFSNCLKSHGTKSGEILGQIYFNFVKVQCLEDGKEGKYFRDSKGF